MARNAAVRKAAKAVKRKAVVAAKRNMEAFANSLSGRVREGATLPILQCMVSDNLPKIGAGVVILSRGVSREFQYVGAFMVDTFCLGVKDAFFRPLNRSDAEQMLESGLLATLSSPAEPAEARKLLHDLVGWAASNGFPPHKDYAVVESLFGGVAPADTDYTAQFGCEGKVLYVPGPTESPMKVRRRMESVRSRFGDAAADLSLLALAGALEDDLELEMEDYDAQD
jgi:hypothetical protein